MNISLKLGWFSIKCHLSNSIFFKPFKVCCNRVKKGRIYFLVRMHRSAFGRAKTGLHCNKHAFRAEKDGKMTAKRCYFLRCKSNRSATYFSNKNSDCPIGQVLEMFYLPTDIFRFPRAIEQALESNTAVYS